MIKRADDHAKNIETAMDFDNLVLYRMCEDEPSHSDEVVVEGKIRVIERVYAASTARGAGKAAATAEPLVRYIAKRLHDNHREIDQRLDEIRKIGVLGAPDVADKCKKLHGDLCAWICCAIRAWRSEQHVDFKNKHKKDMPVRCHTSFASKYLHFHAPNAFPIYDKYSRLGLEESPPNGGFRFGQGYAKFVDGVAQLPNNPDYADLTLRCLDAKLVKSGRRIQAERDEAAQKGK
jgi:hypothetical protein